MSDVAERAKAVLEHLDFDPGCTVVTLFLARPGITAEHHCSRQAEFRATAECCGVVWLACDACRSGSLKLCGCGALWDGRDTAQFDWKVL